MELSGIKGLGQAKIDALQEAGITSLEDLAGLDLRRNVNLPGISQEKLKDYKQQARALLRKHGVSFEKATYNKNPDPASTPTMTMQERKLAKKERRSLLSILRRR